MGAASTPRVSNAMLFYLATQRAKRRARLPEPSPELIHALEKTLSGFKLDWTSSDDIRRQVRITQRRAGELRNSGVLRSLAEAVQTFSIVDRQWLEERAPALCCRAFQGRT